MKVSRSAGQYFEIKYLPLDEFVQDKQDQIPSSHRGSIYATSTQSPRTSFISPDTSRKNSLYFQTPKPQTVNISTRNSQIKEQQQLNNKKTISYQYTQRAQTTDKKTHLQNFEQQLPVETYEKFFRSVQNSPNQMNRKMVEVSTGYLTDQIQDGTMKNIEMINHADNLNVAIKANEILKLLSLQQQNQIECLSHIDLTENYPHQLQLEPQKWLFLKIESFQKLMPLKFHFPKVKKPFKLFVSFKNQKPMNEPQTHEIFYLISKDCLYTINKKVTLGKNIYFGLLSENHMQFEMRIWFSNKRMIENWKSLNTSTELQLDAEQERPLTRKERDKAKMKSQLIDTKRLNKEIKVLLQRKKDRMMQLAGDRDLVELNKYKIKDKFDRNFFDTERKSNLLKNRIMEVQNNKIIRENEVRDQRIENILKWESQRLDRLRQKEINDIREKENMFQKNWIKSIFLTNLAELCHIRLTIYKIAKKWFNSERKLVSQTIEKYRQSAVRSTNCFYYNQRIKIDIFHCLNMFCSQVKSQMELKMGAALQFSIENAKSFQTSQQFNTKSNRFFYAVIRIQKKIKKMFFFEIFEVFCMLSSMIKKLNKKYKENPIEFQKSYHHQIYLKKIHLFGKNEKLQLTKQFLLQYNLKWFKMCRLYLKNEQLKKIQQEQRILAMKKKAQYVLNQNYYIYIFNREEYQKTIEKHERISKQTFKVNIKKLKGKLSMISALQKTGSNPEQQEDVDKQETQKQETKQKISKYGKQMQDIKKKKDKLPDKIDPYLKFHPFRLKEDYSLLYDMLIKFLDNLVDHIIEDQKN